MLFSFDHELSITDRARAFLSNGVSPSENFQCEFSPRNLNAGLKLLGIESLSLMHSLSLSLSLTSSRLNFPTTDNKSSQYRRHVLCCLILRKKTPNLIWYIRFKKAAGINVMMQPTRPATEQCQC